MATRSTIAMEFPNGTVEQVYCHFDGYLDHNGRILAEHYTDPVKIAELIVLGDLSSLKENIGEQHPFSAFEIDDNDPNRAAKLARIAEAKELNWSKFYGRDRGEANTHARKFRDIKDFENNLQTEQYNYIFRKGEWFVSDNDGRSWAKLSRVLEILKEEEVY